MNSELSTLSAPWDSIFPSLYCVTLRAPQLQHTCYLSCSLGKRVSPYKVQAQHTIPNIMNPSSFPQFYILHLHFLSSRKKGNENIEDRSKPDTWRSSRVLRDWSWGIRISAKWCTRLVIQGSQLQVVAGGRPGPALWGLSWPFPGASIITPGNEPGGRQAPPWLRHWNLLLEGWGGGQGQGSPWGKFWNRPLPRLLCVPVSLPLPLMGPPWPHPFMLSPTCIKTPTLGFPQNRFLQRGPCSKITSSPLGSSHTC